MSNKLAKNHPFSHTTVRHYVIDVFNTVFNVIQLTSVVEIIKNYASGQDQRSR
jgi:hypothetical protein